MNETILVVDDIKEVLDVVTQILKTAHYNVLQAVSGADALTVASNHVGPIDLLLSDVKMPLMSGPELGDAIHIARPDTRVMFMSGFPGGFLLVLNYGWAFIEKPFVPAKLIDMVRNVLDKPNRSQGNHQFNLLENIRRKRSQINNGTSGGDQETEEPPVTKKAS